MSIPVPGSRWSRPSSPFMRGTARSATSQSEQITASDGVLTVTRLSCPMCSARASVEVRQARTRMAGGARTTSDSPLSGAVEPE
jgi:hypothetical protein